MNRLFNFTEEVKCLHCKYCKWEDYEESYHCDKKEEFIESVETFDECNEFEPIYSQETLDAIKALEENLYYIPSDVHSIYKSINSENKDTINKAIDAVNSIVDYYVDWIKRVKYEYL